MLNWERLKKGIRSWRLLLGSNGPGKQWARSMKPSRMWDINASNNQHNPHRALGVCRHLEVPGRACSCELLSKGMLHLSASTQVQQTLRVLNCMRSPAAQNQSINAISTEVHPRSVKCLEPATENTENMPMAYDLWLESFALNPPETLETKCCETVALLVRFDPSEVTRLDRDPAEPPSGNFCAGTHGFHLKYFEIYVVIISFDCP